MFVKCHKRPSIGSYLKTRYLIFPVWFQVSAFMHEFPRDSQCQKLGSRSLLFAPRDELESASFYGHLAMMGGMLYVTAFGRWALQSRCPVWVVEAGCSRTKQRRARTSIRSGRPNTTAQQGCLAAPR